jgi:hypothetical protein
MSTVRRAALDVNSVANVDSHSSSHQKGRKRHKRDRRQVRPFRDCTKEELLTCSSLRQAGEHRVLLS